MNYFIKCKLVPVAPAYMSTTFFEQQLPRNWRLGGFCISSDAAAEWASRERSMFMLS